MNAEQRTLYNRIRSFDFDEPDAELTFSGRLVREQRWTAEYALRVIEEYRRFAFLAIATGHAVAPSEQVDAAWHVHLLDTRSYWDAFVPNILGKPLHHLPARGGSREKVELRDTYAQTLESYEHFFGHPAPADIWPPAGVSVEGNEQFRRVNVAEHWVLLRAWPGRPAGTIGSGLAALLIAGSSAPLIAEGVGPRVLGGTMFLSYYASVAVLAILVAILLRWRLRQPVTNPLQNPETLSLYEAAYLTGGHERVVQTAVVNLVVHQHIRLEPVSGNFAVFRPLPGHTEPFELAVVEAVGRDGSLRSIKDGPVVGRASRRIASDLNVRGLLMGESYEYTAGCWPACVVFGTLLVGFVKVVVGITENKPVGALVLFCLSVGAIGCWFLFNGAGLTAAGEQVLEDLRSKSSAPRKLARSGSHADPEEQAWGVALSGISTLTADLSDVRRVLTPPPPPTPECSTGI